MAERPPMRCQARSCAGKDISPNTPQMFWRSSVSCRIVSAMKMRKIYTLVVLWDICLIAPALLVESGLFGPFDMNTNITGSVIGLWIVGYLVKFGVKSGSGAIAEELEKLANLRERGALTESEFEAAKKKLLRG